VAAFAVASEPGNERLAMREVVNSLRSRGLSPDLIERLQTAVAEATMNAMEHGNHYQPDVPVEIEVLESDTSVAVRISDQGHGQPGPDLEAPDIGAKLAGLQSPRGWGLFLIKNMVDELHVQSDDKRHTVEIVLHREGNLHGD
jgi:anti-sigma regulatory factor (Ser/Thr protein kinase)